MKFRTIVFSFLLIGALLVAITPVQADNHIDSGYIDTNDVSSAKFATDRVLVTLTHDASLKFATYSAASFSEISCKGVTDLTSDIGEKVQQKLTQTATAEKTATFTKSASTFMKNLDINSYKQILCLHLSEPGENNVLAAIKSLSSNPAVYSASPDLTPIQVKARILNSAHQISSLSGLCVTGGYLDAAAALDS
jgi:hypothetical protein